MANDITIHILRAFVDEDGRFGNPSGIIVDEKQNLSPSDRQKIATTLNVTDTVFIHNLETGIISLFNPQQETKFAGDALISTSYFVAHVLGKKLHSLVCKGGHVKTWEENGLTWIEGSIEGTPPWNHRQLEDATAVENITKDEASKFKHTMVWAWSDEKKGLIRSRTFLPDWGTLEDQGNGSGSMQLAKMTGRNIVIHQGLGSIIYSSPTGNNSAMVGGRVKLDKSRLMSI